MTNQEQIKDLIARKDALKKFLDIDAKQAWIAEEEKKTEAPDFWNDPKEAQKVVKGINAQKSWVTAYKDVENACGDLEVMGEFFDAGDATEEELVAQIAVTQKKVEDLEFKNMLRNDSDRLDAVLSINAGAGLLLARHIQISANYNIVCKKNAEKWINRNTSYAKETGRSRFHAWQFSIGYYF